MIVEQRMIEHSSERHRMDGNTPHFEQAMNRPKRVELIRHVLGRSDICNVERAVSISGRHIVKIEVEQPAARSLGYVVRSIFQAAKVPELTSVDTAIGVNG